MFELAKRQDRHQRNMSSKRFGWIPSGKDQIHNPFLVRQRNFGNQFLQRCAKSCPAQLMDALGGTLHMSRVRQQRKLIVNKPGDIYEKEAERVADRVMRMPSGVSPTTGNTPPQRKLFVGNAIQSGQYPELQRAPLDENLDDLLDTLSPRESQPAQQPVDLDEKERQRREREILRQLEKLRREEEIERLNRELFGSPNIQRSPAEIQNATHPNKNTVKTGVSGQVQRLDGKGQPLPDSLRAFFEPRFGYDFNPVRVHVGHGPAELARTLSARAFTFGRNVVFGSGQYAPNTEQGKRLIAHELTHVVQQRGGPYSGPANSGMTPVVLKLREKTVQRSYTLERTTVHHDIDPFDPETWPSTGGEDTRAPISVLGETKLLVNDREENAIGRLFPFPQFEESDSHWYAPLSYFLWICHINRDIGDIRVHSDVRLINPGPWTRRIPKSNIATLFRDAHLGDETVVSSLPDTCSGSGDTEVVIRGNPDDMAARNFALRAEMQHVRDDQCLFNRYFRGYETAVQALPNSFLSWEGCQNFIIGQLRRQERLLHFGTDKARFRISYDGPQTNPSGPHSVSLNGPLPDRQCNRIMFVFMNDASTLVDEGRDCSPWSPEPPQGEETSGQ